jgi:hypothetical protein
MIQDSEREGWAHNPVTVEFIEVLTTAYKDAKEAWALEKYVGETGEITLQANAKALGGIYALRQVIEIIEGYKGAME